MRRIIERGVQTAVLWEWVILVLLLVPLIYLSGRWYGLFLLLIPIQFGLRRLATGHFFPTTPYDLPILGLLIMMLISRLLIPMQSSFSHTAGLILAFAIFYTIVYMCQQRPQHTMYVIAFFLLTGTGMSLISLFGVNWNSPFRFLRDINDFLPAFIRALLPISKAEGLSINANEIAGVLDWVLPMSIALLIGLWRWLWQQNILLCLLLLTSTLFNTFILVATQSRGGILSFSISLLVVFTLSYSSPIRSRGVSLLLIILVWITLVTFFFLRESSESATTIVNSFEGRLELWSRALYALSDFPFTGLGLNNFRHVVNVMYPFFLIPATIDIAHAHNHLLQAGLDVGLPGLVAYLSLWVVSTLMLYQSWQRYQNEIQKNLIIGLSGAIVGGWVFGILDTISLGARPGFMWWIILALIAVIHQQTAPSHLKTLA